MKVRNETDLCLAYQCAPVLAGIKTSNIFMAKGMEEKQLEEIFRDTPLNSVSCGCTATVFSGRRPFWSGFPGEWNVTKKGSRNSLMNWAFSLVIPWRMCGDLSIIRERTIFTVVIGKYMAT